MRFNKFNEVVSWYERTKPIISKNHTREHDVHPCRSSQTFFDAPSNQRRNEQMKTFEVELRRTSYIVLTIESVERVWE